MRKSLARKGKLMLMIAFSVLSFASLSVATLAWFTTNATATFSTAQMTVDAGLQYKLYQYRIKNTATSVYEDEPEIDPENDTFDTYFHEITAISNVSDWSPGKKVTYAIEIYNYVSNDDLYLYLSRYNSPVTGDALRRVDYDVATDAQADVRLAWAINIYSEAYADKETGYATFFAAQEAGTLDDHLDISRGTYVAADSSITDSLCHTTDIEGTYTFFYTLEYSDAATTHYREVDKNGNTVVMTPTDATKRFFKTDDTVTGNSNCYAGLRFTVDGLTVTTA